MRKENNREIIKQITDAIPKETRSFIEKIKQNYDRKKIVETIRSLKDLKVLVIGDAILDKYTYVQPMEKSAKEPIISNKYLRSEIHAGGVFAVANHVAEFSNNSDLVTVIGNNKLKIVKKSINSKIKQNLFTQKDTETIVKERYIDAYLKIKMFQLYNNDHLILNKEIEDKIVNLLIDKEKEIDLIIVSDFGHGLITEKITDYLFKSNKFLAINCQLNAGNLGYNFITNKHKRADFVSINERELRLPLQERDSKIEIPIKKLSNILNVKKINTTKGKEGSIYYDNGKFYQGKAFTTNPGDTMGTGDAVFAITSLLAYKNLEPELISFLSNGIGSIATKIVGNRNSVSLDELESLINYVLR